MISEGTKRFSTYDSNTDCFFLVKNTKDFSDSIDKACEESVNDLMATIAKLDSNGVQVLPEGRGKTTSPQVHSSTDMMTIGPVIESE